MIKGAIFDMDGTVLDSMHLWHDIGPRFLAHIGVKTDLDVKTETKNMLFKEMNNYFNSHGITDNMSLEEFTYIANSMVEIGYYDEVQVKPGVVEFIQKLKAKNIPIVLATATDRHLVKAALKRNGISEYFDEIFTCNELQCTKQTTTIYDAANEFLGTPKSETYIFEDTMTPIKTLSTSEYKVVGVYDKWSAKKADEIKKLVDFYVENLNELDLNVL